MDSGLRIVRLTDYSIPLGIMDACWDEMNEDGSERFIPDLVKEIWLGIIVDNYCVGFWRACQITSVLYECHICILPKYRHISRESGWAFYKWLLDNMSIEKLICNIPDFNKRALAFARSIGFRRQGFNSNSYMRNKELCGMIQLGVSRESMEDLCHQQ